MAKLLHLNRPSRRVREVVRAWWVAHLQHRRRERASGPIETPGAPVPGMQGGYYAWGDTEEGWADVVIYWAIDYGGFPEASVEVWMRAGAGQEQCVGTVPSVDGGFYHAKATAVSGVTVYYRTRYVDGRVCGAFSEVTAMEVVL